MPAIASLFQLPRVRDLYFLRLPSATRTLSRTNPLDACGRTDIVEAMFQCEGDLIMDVSHQRKACSSGDGAKAKSLPGHPTLAKLTRRLALNLTCSVWILTFITGLVCFHAGTAVASGVPSGPAMIEIRDQSLIVRFGYGKPKDSVTCDTRTKPCRTFEVTGTVNGASAFRASFDATDQLFVGFADLETLDPSTMMPQVLIVHYTGGTHCCWVTDIETLDLKGDWHLIHAGESEQRLRVEDIDHKGYNELIGKDESFYYEFGSFASSVAPTRILRLEGGKIIDVTKSPRFVDYLLGQEEEMSNYATNDNELWRSSGFLGGWVAEEALLGQFPRAWRAMLAKYNHSPAFDGPPLPMALMKHLVHHGYVSQQKLSVEDYIVNRKSLSDGFLQISGYAVCSNSKCAMINREGKASVSFDWRYLPAQEKLHLLRCGGACQAVLFATRGGGSAKLLAFHIEWLGRSDRLGAQK